MLNFIITLILGFLFGTVLIASEAFSWYRIQEMFYFKSFHMFGVLFSAIGTAAVFVFIIKKKSLKSVYGEVIQLEPKKTNWKRSVFGGLIFGAGWTITGACTAPIYILVGFKWQIGIAVLLGAVIGTFIYSLVATKIEK
jgi:uncharacterized membrane protein YedE/YeeE